MTNNEKSYIALFDGHCNLCNNAVQFIIKRDPTSKFRFAFLQSEITQKLLSQLAMSTQGFDTFVLIKDSKVFTKSTATLQIARELSGFWKLCYIFIILPKPIRDYLYTLIARNRYRLFGKKDSCMLTTPDIRQMCLEN